MTENVCPTCRGTKSVSHYSGHGGSCATTQMPCPTCATLDDILGLTPRPTAADVRAKVAAMSDEDVVRLWEKLKAL